MLLSMETEGRVKHMRKIRVLLADDHETVQEQVRAILGKDFDIIGAVNNGQDAVAETQRLDPDVLVIDISMPILNGFQAVRQLQTKNTRAKIVFLTVHEDPDFVAAAFSAGASAYVLKSEVTSDLAPAIRETLQGGTYVSKTISP
jgi:DNA-binding NarL/FixJ family response regulator